MPRLLIVEDDPKIVAAVEKTLALGQAYVWKAMSDPEKVVSEAARYKPDLVLLDIRLPGGDGRMVLKKLKENAATAAIPVIMLTGMSSESDKVLGLNLGADDYVVKPFGAMELLARVQAVVRRTLAAPAASHVASGGLALDRDSRVARLNGRTLALQPKEFQILYLLVSQPGRSLSRGFLIENSSSYGLPVSTRSLDTHIKNLRRKLGAAGRLIETVPKLGYRFHEAR